MSRRQIGIAGGVPAASINPVVVEPFQLIIIMYALVFAKVEGGIGDAETILAVLQAYLLTVIEHRLDRSTLGGTNHLVMNLQMAELQGDIPQRIDISGIKHGDTIGTAEHQTAIRQLARGTIGKLIASQSVGLIKCSHRACLGVETVQAFHGTNPQITLSVFLNATYIRT